MRQITRRIADCNKPYKEIEDKLKRNHVKYGGMLISIDTGIAYLFIDNDTIIFLLNTKRQHGGFETMTV
jgi:hypothetical protein